MKLYIYIYIHLYSKCGTHAQVLSTTFVPANGQMLQMSRSQQDEETEEEPTQRIENMDRKKGHKYFIPCPPAVGQL